MAEGDLKGQREVSGTYTEVKLQDYLLPLAGGILTGEIDLGENAGIVFDAALSADGKYSGFCVSGTAGAALAFGECCYFAVADSRWELAKFDAVATSSGRLGMCVLAAAGDGSATKMLIIGKIRADAKFPTLAFGAPVWGSAATAGLVVAGSSSTPTTGQPTGTDNVIRRLGDGITADEMFFNPSPDFITHT